MLRAAEDCAAASWILENLHGFAQDVGSVARPVSTLTCASFIVLRWEGGVEPSGDLDRDCEGKWPRLAF